MIVAEVCLPVGDVHRPALCVKKDNKAERAVGLCRPALNNNLSAIGLVPWFRGWWDRATAMAVIQTLWSVSPGAFGDDFVTEREAELFE